MQTTGKKAELKLLRDLRQLTDRFFQALNTGMSFKTVSHKEITLLKNETKQLSASLEPSSSGDVIVWQSLDEDIATVSDIGLVTAIYRGKTEIIASLQGTTISDTCEVSVSLNSLIKSRLKSEISIYPNPNNGNFVLSLPQEFIVDQIIIYDLLSKIVLLKQVEGFINRVSLNINPGTYIHKTVSEEKVNTIQLLIN